MPSILIIEDDDLFRGTLADALESQGYTVSQAADGDDGVKRYHAAPTDLVLTDVVMPNKEGIATVMELRRAYPKLGIIVMSGGLAKDAPLYLQLAGGLGADRTLQKPFPLTELLKAVKEVLDQGGHVHKPRHPPGKPTMEGWQ
jgi:DNA-binding response OmpR family regulator